MSGPQRNLNHGEKIILPRTRQLPEVICESPLNSPGNSFGEEINGDILETLNCKAKLRHNSTASSAQSQRFQDMFYNTDWPSLSDTGTDSPDCVELEGSDSSASSMFSWADAEGTKMVCEEWEKIQRTLYNEDGPKVTQKHLIEECNQWNTIFPHLRVVGRSLGVSNLDNDDSYDTEEEVLALHYDSDAVMKEVIKAPFMMNEQFSQDNNCHKLMPLRSRKKSNVEEVPGLFSQNDMRSKSSTTSLVEELDSFLHITPITQNSSSNNYTFENQSSTIIKSEITSSRWRQRNTSPDFVSFASYQVYGNSTQTRDSSAASLFSLASARKNIININHNTLSIATTRNKSSYKSQNSEKRSKQNISEKHCHLLEPLEPLLANKILPNRSISIPQVKETINSGGQKGRNVSLPPIQSDENKGRRKQLPDIITFSGKSSRRNKTTLIPINFTPSSIPKQNIGGDFNTFSLLTERSVASKKTSNRKKSSKKNKS